MSGKFVILMDGGFVKKKIKQRTNNFPTVADFGAEIVRIKQHQSLTGCELLRVYFYDAPPASGHMKNPIDQSSISLDAHPDHPKSRATKARREKIEIDRRERAHWKATSGPAMRYLDKSRA